MKKRHNPFTGKLEDHPPPKTYLCPPRGRPTRATISKFLGFQVPLPFVEFVEWVHDQADGDPYRCVEVFFDFLGIEATRGPSIYDATPPELFPFGDPAVDGVQFGHLVHAPELQQSDYPVAQFCPMDSDGVTIEAADTFQGLVSIASLWNQRNPQAITPDLAGWRTALAKLKKAKRNVRSRVEDVVTIPEGWRFLPSSDRVGVLAPAKLFGSKKLPELDPYGPGYAFMTAAESALKKGLLGDALFFLREAYWFNWTEQPTELCDLLCEVYQKLNRPEFAKVIAARVKKWKKAAK